MWVARTSLVSPAAITAMVRSAKSSGFNTLLVQVRARGDAYFASDLEPRAAALAGQSPSFDPLAVTLQRAHEQGLVVHAWVNVSLVSGAAELPSAKSHVVFRHPEWLMIPRALARDMMLLDPGTRLYLDKLARRVRSQPTDLEGLYLSPVIPEAADHTVAVFADLVDRYPIDGIHLDYLRYPTDEFDYSREALGAFKTEMDRQLSDADLRDLRLSDATDLLSYPERFAERWRIFRQDRLTALVARIRAAIKSRRPATLVTAAVVPDPVEASKRRLQNWRNWLADGLLDVVCPMAYAPDPLSFTAQLAGARQVIGDRPMWAGIGAYRLSSLQTVENIRIARRLGASGVILFSYDSVAGSPHGVDYLSQVGRAAFDQQQ